MAHISRWEKFRRAVTGSYSDELTLEIAHEEAKVKAAAIAAEKARLEAAAKAKA